MAVETHGQAGQAQPSHHPVRSAAHGTFRQHQAAFSLFDMLVTLMVASSLSALMIPTFKHLMAHTRLTTQVNQLLTDLHLARSEAIKRREHVVLCQSTNGLHCTSSAAWHDGWLMFVDPNDNHQVDPDETVIRVQGRHTRVLTHLNASGGTQRNYYLGYRPDGLSGKRGTFTLCDPSSPHLARAIIIYWTGRPRVSDKADDGRALACPDHNRE